LRDKKGNKKNTEGFEFCVVPAKYPMGEEHLLIKQVLGKTLQKDEHPTDAGILVMNVQTAYQVYCLLTDQYHNGRYITLADLNSGDARVEYVKRGENIKEKLMKCFPRDTDDDYFAGSGILSAHVIEDDEIFSDEISFAAIGNTTDISNNVACKGCGKCNRNCPAGVNIKKIVKRKEANLQADITDLGTENCIHCGSCTFFCRAGKNIAEYLEK
jgi:electron transport complex protein RnfC